MTESNINTKRGQIKKEKNQQSNVFGNTYYKALCRFREVLEEFYVIYIPYRRF